MTTWKASVTGSDGSAAAHSVIITGTPRAGDIDEPWDTASMPDLPDWRAVPSVLWVLRWVRSSAYTSATDLPWVYRLGRYSSRPRMGIARSRPSRQCRAMDSRNDFGAGGCVVAGQLRGHDRIASDGHSVFQCAPACSASRHSIPSNPWDSNHGCRRWRRGSPRKRGGCGHRTVDLSSRTTNRSSSSSSERTTAASVIVS